MTVTEALQHRRATPSFDPNISISRAEIESLIDTASLAPSSMNLQPWDFLVVDTAEDKLRMQGAAMNQKKVTEASAVIAVLGNLNFVDHAEAVVDGLVERGYLPAERKEGMLGMAQGFNQDAHVRRDEAIRSSNLWAMAFMLVAKEAGWDTAPMGGFSAEAVSKEFGLPESHFPIILIAIGKVNPEVKILDRNIRFSAKELVHYDNW